VIALTANTCRMEAGIPHGLELLAQQGLQYRRQGLFEHRHTIGSQGIGNGRKQGIIRPGPGSR